MKAGSARSELGGLAILTGTLIAAGLLWPAPAGIWFQGAIVGSLTALSAFGIGLVFRSSGSINLAQADLGLVPLTIFVGLVTNHNLSYLPALAVAIVAAVLLGLAVERLVIRWFRSRAKLVMTVATLGLGRLLAAFAQGLSPSLHLKSLGGAGTFGSTGVPSLGPGTTPAPTAPSPLIGGPAYPSPLKVSVHVGPAVLTGGDVVALICVAAVIVALTAFLRATSTGLALRSIADSEERSSLLGIPVPRLHSLVWAVVSVLSALSLIFRGGIYGIPQETLFGPSFLLRVLVVAVIGRFENYAVMFIAALGIGMLELSISWHGGSTSWVDPLLAMIIVGTLVIQHAGSQDPLADRSTWRQVSTRRPIPAAVANLASVRIVSLTMVVLSVAVALTVPLLDLRSVYLATAIITVALATLSVVILTGWAGEITLGQMAVVAVGCVVANFMKVRRVEPLIILISSGAAGAAAGALVAGLARKMRGIHLAVVTLAVGVGTSTYISNAAHLWEVKERFVPRQRLLWLLPVDGVRVFYYVALGVLLAVVWLATGVHGGRTGRVFVAVRENEQAAQTFGVNVIRTRLVAFAVAGFVAGMAGGLMVIHQLVIPTDLIGPSESIRALAMAAIGGLSSLVGGVLGSVFIKSTQWFNGVVPATYRQAFVSAGTGSGLLFVLMLAPAGLAGAGDRVRDAWIRRVATRKAIRVPALRAEAPLRPLDDSGDATRFASARGPGRLRGAVRWRGTVRASPETTTGRVLELRSVRAAYGHVQVLFGVSLEVASGEVVALLGTNGSGKSTLLRTVSGLLTVRGDIDYEGRPLRRLAPHKVARLGVTHVPARDSVFPSLTVAENLKLAAWVQRRDRSLVGARTADVIDIFPDLAARMADKASNLSGGQQQMLRLAMGLLPRSQLLMIDELSLGLAPPMVDRALAAVRAQQESGTTVLLAEQSVDVARSIADRAYFLERGELRFGGQPAELLDRPDLLRSIFLGGTTPSSSPQPNRSGSGQQTRRSHSQPVLEAHRVSKAFLGLKAVEQVSLRVAQREILGIIGPNGAGKTTLLDLLSGFLSPDTGSIRMNGREVSRLPPDERARLGLGRSFQDARLFDALTVRDAIAVAMDRHLHPETPLGEAFRAPHVEANRRKLQHRVSEITDRLNIGDLEDKFIFELSHGSRRVVDVACQMAMRPSVLLLDEPSAGLAHPETEALGPLLLRLRQQTGATLIVVDHDVSLVASVADRLLAMHLGRSIACGEPADILRDQEVASAYLGAPPTLDGPVAPPTSRTSGQ